MDWLHTIEDGKKKKRKNREGKAHDFLARNESGSCLGLVLRILPPLESHESDTVWRVVKGKRATMIFFEHTKKKKKIIELTLCGTRTCIMIVDNSVQDSFQYG